MHPWQRRFPRLWSAMETASVWMVASVLFWLGWVLIIPGPLGTAVAFRMLARRRERAAYSALTWREEVARLWWPAMGAGWLAALAALVLYLDARAVYYIPSTVLRLGSIPLVPIGVVVLMLQVAFWVGLAVEPGSSRTVLGRALALVLRHPGRMLAAGVAGVLAGFALWIFSHALMVLLGPALVISIWLRMALGAATAK